MSFTRNYEKGQILLVVILAAVVALTVGIAAISRSITNTKVSSEEESSQKALSAAEAGVEEIAGNASYLASGSTGTKTLPNSSTFNAVAIATTPLSPFALNGGQLVSKDEGADIWLSTYPSYTNQWSGTLTIYWQKQSLCVNDSAIEIVVLSGASTNTPSVYRYAVDRCSGSRPSSNGFSAPTSTSANITINGVTYNNSYTLPAISSGFIARVIPLYNDTKIAVGFTGSLPSQGSVITSTGTSGDTHRTIQLVKGYPRVPVELFPYNIFLPQ